jgi:hypothetical protein
MNAIKVYAALQEIISEGKKLTRGEGKRLGTYI